MVLNPSQLEQVHADKKRFFQLNSRSFSFASLGFRPSERTLVQSVYAFCRITDDLVDEHVGDDVDEIDRDLDEWIQISSRSFAGTELSGIEWLDSLMHESAARGVPFEIIEELVEGVRKDTGLEQLRTIDDLRAYCYGVASTVGIWMCHLFGVQDPEMLDRAEALGRAMQLTNILRDVGADLAMGRVYIPSELLREYGLSTSDLIVARETGTIPRRYDELIRYLMSLADDDYETGWEAIPQLPNSFARAAAVATEVYRGIHRRIESNGYDNLTTRARTGSLHKFFLMQRALLRLWFKRWFSPRLPLSADSSRGERSRSAPRQSILMLLPMLYVMAGPAQAQVPNTAVQDARTFYWGTVEAEHIDSVQTRLSSDKTLRKDPIATAYVAALEVLKAKYAFWPGTKLAHVNAGLPVLDSLVTSNPDLVEPRYLRLLSCYFLPGLLKRQWSVDEDTHALAVSLRAAGDQVPVEQYKQMLRFVLQNGRLDESEFDQLKPSLTALYERQRQAASDQ